MADPDISEIDQSVAPPIGGDINFNLNNERLDCEHLGKKSPEAGDYQNINKIGEIDHMTDSWTDTQRPSFVTALLRFFGNVFGERKESIPEFNV